MDLLRLAEQVKLICEQAGAAIKAVYESNESVIVTYKEDDSPVTEADNRANAIIVAALANLNEGLPVLSEEGHNPSFDARRKWSMYWLVDPLDGTREFVDRTGEFTINIALIDRGRPVLGVIHLPLERKTYTGVIDHGAWREDAAGKSPIAVSGFPAPNASARVLTSSRYQNSELEEMLKSFEQRFSAVTRIKAGSALKFCLLAEGRGDIYPRFPPCCEWDTAAGQAVLEAAGGALVSAKTFQTFRYNQKESLINASFYALGGALASWQAVLEKKSPKI